MDRRTIFVISIAGLVIILGLFGWQYFRDSSLTNIQHSNTIRIGYAVEAPYVFLGVDGEVTGAEAETARIVVNRLGIAKIEWRLSEFDNLIDELRSGEVDVIVAGMFITPERAELVSFSEPTFHVQQGMLAAAGNPLRLKSYAQVASLENVKIAVLTGSVEEHILNELEMDPARMVLVPDAHTGLSAVETGIADGFALSSVSIRWMALQDQLGRTEMIEPFEQTIMADNRYFGYGGVVFRKEDLQLKNAWNAILKDLTGSPQHIAILNQFGFSNADLPGSVTTREILTQP